MKKGRNNKNNDNGSSSNGSFFDYMVMRTEDLFLGSSQERYESLAQLAGFVGSPRSHHRYGTIVQI